MYLFLLVPVKLVGKLHDGTIFMRKGHDNEPFEFKIDEGNEQCYGLTLSETILS